MTVTSIHAGAETLSDGGTISVEIANTNGSSIVVVAIDQTIFGIADTFMRPRIGTQCGILVDSDGYNIGSDRAIQAYVILNPPTGTQDVTFDGGFASATADIIIGEITDVSFDNCINIFDHAQITNQEAPDLNVTTTVANTILIHLSTNNSGGTPTAKSDWTLLDSSDDFAVSYSTQASAGASTNAGINWSSATSTTDWALLTFAVPVGDGYPSSEATETEASKNMKASKRRYRP